MRKKLITIITSAIIAIGIFSGLLILLDYLESPHLISKQNALAIAKQRSLCADSSANAMQSLEIHLLHEKNNTLFAVNERTMQDMSLANAPHFTISKTRYVWEVTWECYFSISKERGSQINFVDAVTGKLIEKF